MRKNDGSTPKVILENTNDHKYLDADNILGYDRNLKLKMFLKKIITIFSPFLSFFWNVICSLVNIFYMVFCIKIIQSNAGCYEIELNFVVKFQNVSCGKQSKENKVK